MPREVPPAAPARADESTQRLWVPSAWGAVLGCIVAAIVIWRMGYAPLFPERHSAVMQATLIGVVLSLLMGTCGLHLLVGVAWLRAGWRRTAKVWFDFWVPATIGLAVLDTHVFAATGRHAWFYLTLAVEADAGRWVGGSPWGQLAMGLPLAGTLIAATVAARLTLAGARWVDGRWRLPGSPRAMAVGLGLLVPLLGIGPWVGGDARARAGRVLADALPVDPWLGYRPGSVEMWERRLEPRLQPVFDDAFSDPLAAPALPVAPRSPRRDVVVLVLESWRADALTAETMPRLTALAKDGLVFEQHHSAANSSYLGLFSLLHARPPLRHREIAADVTAPPAASLRDAGAASVWVSCGDHSGYEGMEALLDATFDRVEANPTDAWNDGDRETLERLHTILNNATPGSPAIAIGGLRQRPPIFAVGFLMSTHFAYFSPAGAKPHLPEARVASLLWPWLDHAPLRNRYRNAAAFLDGEIADFIGRLDLDRTLVVITGDHGQSLYDDGVLGHWSRLSDAQTRVPLLMLGAGVEAGRYGEPTTHADVMKFIEHPPARSALAERQSPRNRPVLLMQSRIADPTDTLAILRGFQRLGLRLHRREGGTPRVEVLGLLDASGRLDTSFTDMSDIDAAMWIDATRAAIAE